ncbi:MAG: FAD-binding oxidoreductase [Parvularculaceae bacterium]|nr:FAD-binding oxidoreductase [Parvularculaceae bacterium]
MSSNNSKLIDELRTIVGAKGLLSGDMIEAQSERFSDQDGANSAFILRPSSADELSNLMKVLHRFKQPVAIQGGLTGLVDGATIGAGEIALSLERMKKVISINAPNRTMIVEAGATIQHVQEAAEAEGLMFAADWGARGSATVGGGIACNAGGNAVLRYGMMREQVLGLEVVLSDGSVLSSMNSMLKSNAGYDLKQLFIGSEGTLGIVSKAVLRLRPLFDKRATALVSVSNFDRVAKLLAAMDKFLGGSLSAFEVMWGDFYQLMLSLSGKQALLPVGSNFYVLIESSGANEEVEQLNFQYALEQAYEAELVEDAVVSASETQRSAIWTIRDDVELVFKEFEPVKIFDVSLEIQFMEQYVSIVNEKMIKAFPDSRGVVFGHLADGNLHFCWGLGGGEDVDDRAAKIMYESLERFGGSISAEHGIGREKRKYLSITRSELEVEWMKKLKSLFDPECILNRGRVFSVR